MDNFDDYLTSQGVPQLPQAQVQAPSPAAPVDNATPVEGVEVAAPRLQGLNYSAPSSIQSAQSAKDSLNNPAFNPQGGGANPGIWGLLPENIQHGTLRNVLGALGDAFLVTGGRQAQYGPRMERKQEGLAMADYADHPEMAIGRMAATGTPDAMKNATSLQNNLNNVEARKAAAQQTAEYRQESLNQRNDAAEGRLAVQQQNQIRALIPQVGGIVSRAQTPDQYLKAYTQAENIAQSIDPKYHASHFGLIPPEDWQPGTIQGTTGSQQMNDQAKTASRATTQRGQDLSYRGRIQSAGIAAGSRAATAGMGPIDRGIMQEAQKNGVDSLDAASRARYDKITNVPKKTTTTGAGAGLHSATTAAAKGTAPKQQMTPAQAQALPSGTHFIGTDGKEYIKH